MAFKGSGAVLLALIWRPLLREKTRTLLTIAGVAVGVAVIVAIQLANDSALQAFRDSIDAVSGRANFQIAGDAGTVDEAVLLRLQPLWREGVRFAPVIDLEGLASPANQPIRLLAVDLLSDLHFRDYRYARIEQASAGADTESLTNLLALFRTDSIVLPEPFARERGLRVGSPFELEIRGVRRTMTVRGILEARGPATAFNGAIAICDIATAQEAFGWQGRLSRVDLLIPEENSSRLIAAIQRDLPAGVRIERPSRRNERVTTMLRAFRVNLFALGGVAVLVGMFLVYNTVLISILRRRKEIGIVKTLGVSPGQITFSFLVEGALFGVLGTATGIPLGIGLARGILGLIGQTINALYVSSNPAAVQLTPNVVLLASAVGLGLALIAAIQPALEAAEIRPSTMIRAGLQQRVAEKRRHLLRIASIVLYAAGAAATQIPPLRGIAVGGYLAVLLVVGATALLAPDVVRLTAAASAEPFARLFGLVGRLAAASLPASLRRTAVATAALATAIGMMVAVALMVGSFRATVSRWIDQTISSDVWLRPAKGLSNAQIAVFQPPILDELRRVPFIEAFDPVRGRDVVYGESYVTIGSGDFAVSSRHGTLPMIAPRSGKTAFDDARRSGGVFVSESFSLKYGKTRGDTVTIPTNEGPRAFRISGVYRDYSNDRGTIVMDRSIYIAAFGDQSINTIVIYLREGTDPATAVSALERQFGAKYHAFAVTNRAIRNEVMKIFDQTFLITYALLGVAVVVGFLGIINTLSALILERKRELALLRVSGMTVAEVRRMLLLESALLGIAATISGVLMGYALSWILINVINKQSFGWTIEFDAPWGLLAASLAVTFAASTLAGFIPARGLARLDLAGAIKSE